MKDCALDLEKWNAAAVEELITTPLRKAQKRLVDLAGGYYLVYSFKSRCRSVARESVLSSKSLDANLQEFLDDAIEHWLRSPEMTRLIDGADYCGRV